MTQECLRGGTLEPSSVTHSNTPQDFGKLPSLKYQPIAESFRSDTGIHEDLEIKKCLSQLNDALIRVSANSNILPSEVAYERRLVSLGHRKPSVERILEILDRPRTNTRQEAHQSIHSVPEKESTLKADGVFRLQSQEDRATTKDSAESDIDYNAPRPSNHDIVAVLSTAMGTEAHRTEQSK